MGNINIRCFSLLIAYVLVYCIFISLINAVEIESALSYGWKAEKAWGDGVLESPIDLKDEQVLILPTLDDLRGKYKPSLAKDPEAEDESGFSYDWRAPNGPQNWGNLNPNWTKCGTGKSQSPINIVENSVVLWPSPGNLIRRYKPASAVIQNKGHDIQVSWTGDAGSILIRGCEFKLVQCHWHIPSEHKVNGVRYNMELHLVHTNSRDEIAVVGILYKLGQPADPFLAMLSPYLSSADGNGTDLGEVNPYDIGFKGQKYFRYNGSLTTPPCSENVTWTVMKTVKTVSSKQIQELRDAVNDTGIGNARPIQQLNGRNVYMYKPRSWIESS